jgi:hypothetical protein
MLHEMHACLYFTQKKDNTCWKRRSKHRNKTTQVKIRQGKTRQDKTRQHSTAQHNTTQHNTTQGDTTQVNTTQDTRQDNTTQLKTRRDRTGQEDQGKVQFNLELLSLSLSEELSSLSDEEDDDEEEEESLSLLDAARAFASSCAFINFGRLAKCARRPSVKAPSWIEVKKLIANRVSRGLFRGKTPANHPCIDSSLNLSFSFRIPMPSDNSWQRILMKIRLLEVVSSSFNLMYSNTLQAKASVC